MKHVILALASLSIVFLAACSTTPYEVKESDKLTDKEKFHLFDYSRHFINKTLDTEKKTEPKNPVEKRLAKKPQKKHFGTTELTSQEKKLLKELVASKDPVVRVRYTGTKQGKISLSWLLPGKFQINVSADGKLDLSGAKQANWRLNIIKYQRDCYMLPEELGIPAVE